VSAARPAAARKREVVVGPKDAIAMSEASLREF